jgi:hypothetical protein
MLGTFSFMAREGVKVVVAPYYLNIYSVNVFCEKVPLPTEMQNIVLPTPWNLQEPVATLQLILDRIGRFLQE